MNSGFGKPGRPGASDAEPRPKPRKRPTQARARFTVEAIYEGFVRIWRRDGWERLTTRAVALETGVAVGTLYEYFPSKEALLSGYIRHCIEAMLARLDAEAVQPSTLSWRERLHRLVQISGDQQASQPLFDAGIGVLEQAVAEPKHHQRAFEELAGKWREVLGACHDLPQPAAAQLAEPLFLLFWGGRRYCVPLRLSAAQIAAWLDEAERTLEARLAALDVN
ncbi:TetR/AcrR family transcriptional regulator [Pseudomonas sp. UL073]|uniref:TetR/AcrR family transcriptional regulator n=1 Tax=Zestomonas insulae TaxID=2809017 RepID=A0ABS2IDV1_9GAMM|nr:TetR/AcrR family transcriptional regulator [Pseudomonas insulae]MBM7061269.1 TetR/AcrR family transcriptional regulator [Pseudomonas insulae]